MKKTLLKIWDRIYEIKQKIVFAWWAVFDFFYQHCTQAPNVAGVEETIRKIRDDKCSFARFGDGEIKLVAGRSISFQTATPFITQKLREVLSSDMDGLLIGLADIFGDRSRYTEKANAYWKKHLSQYRRVWYRYIRKGKQYYNASATRHSCISTSGTMMQTTAVRTINAANTRKKRVFCFFWRSDRARLRWHTICTCEDIKRSTSGILTSNTNGCKWKRLRKDP